MNFALSTIVFIIFLLPGAIAQKSYYGHFKVKKASIHIPFSETLFSGILYSLIIHVSAICIITVCLNAIPKFGVLYEIVSGKELKLTDEEYTHFFKQFGLYNISVITITWVFTKAFKHTIEYLNIHINYNSFRNANYWFELFSAKYLDRTNVKGQQKTTDLIFVDVLTDAEIIYSGFLRDFNYSPQKDELENIIITSTTKRIFSISENHDKLEGEKKEKAIENTKVNNNKPLQISGDAFVIPASKIVNINIYYIKLTKTTSTTSKA